MALCGAKTRSGEPCKRHPGRGSKRCKLHGGGASVANQGNKHASTPGSIYSKFYSKEEQLLADQIKLGQVDEELRLTRIRLMRAMAHEQEHANTLEADTEKREPLEIDGVVVEGSEKVTTTTKVRDYWGLIDRLTARVESLERTRINLVEAERSAGGGDESALLQELIRKLPG